jgi:hypothetical protein
MFRLKVAAEGKRAAPLFLPDSLAVEIRRTPRSRGHCTLRPLGMVGSSLSLLYFSNPYTSTSLRVPRYTRPLTTMGITNRAAIPASSRSALVSEL